MHLISDILCNSNRAFPDLNTKLFWGLCEVTVKTHRITLFMCLFHEGSGEGGGIFCVIFTLGPAPILRILTLSSLVLSGK